MDPNSRGVFMGASRKFGPYYNNLSLLLHCDGTNGSTNFVDNSPNSLVATVEGNASISTAQSKFGGASAYFDGSGDRISYGNNSLFNFGTGDFTVEAWVYAIDQLKFYVHLMGKGSGISSSGEWVVALYGGPFYFAGGGIALTGTTQIPNNTWNHVAVTRQSGTVRLFVNGIQEATGTGAGDITSSRTFNIGDRESGDQYLNYPHYGYMDEIRITKGVAMYTSNFAVQTAPFVP